MSLEVSRCHPAGLCFLHTLIFYIIDFLPSQNFLLPSFMNILFQSLAGSFSNWFCSSYSIFCSDIKSHCIWCFSCSDSFWCVSLMFSVTVIQSMIVWLPEEWNTVMLTKQWKGLPAITQNTLIVVVIFA